MGFIAKTDKGCIQLPVTPGALIDFCLDTGLDAKDVGDLPVLSLTGPLREHPLIDALFDTLQGTAAAGNPTTLEFVNAGVNEALDVLDHSELDDYARMVIRFTDAYTFDTVGDIVRFCRDLKDGKWTPITRDVEDAADRWNAIFEDPATDPAQLRAWPVKDDTDFDLIVRSASQPTGRDQVPSLTVLLDSARHVLIDEQGEA